MDRRRSGARRAVPQRRLSEERDRSRHHRDAARRAPAAAGRSDPHAARQHAAGQRRRLLPDGTGRSQPARSPGSPSARSTGRMSATSSTCRKREAPMSSRQGLTRGDRGSRRRRCARLPARRLLRHLLRPARDDRARRRRRGRRQHGRRRWSIRGRRTATTTISPSTASGCSGAVECYRTNKVTPAGGSDAVDRTSAADAAGQRRRRASRRRNIESGSAQPATASQPPSTTQTTSTSDAASAERA